MAIRNMRVNPNTRISTSLGFNPRGVIVDNITSYWLYFPQADQYCPPFTIGWTAPFTQQMAGYAYMEIKTPFGQTNQINTPAGVSQFVNLVWTDNDVAFNPGLPSQSGSIVDPSGTTPAVSQIQVGYDEVIEIDVSTGLTTSLINIGTNQQLKLVSAQFHYARDSWTSFSDITNDSPLHFTLRSQTLNSFFAVGSITPTNPVFQYVPQNPITFELGEDLWFEGRAVWANVMMDYLIDYILLTY